MRVYFSVLVVLFIRCDMRNDKRVPGKLPDSPSLNEGRIQEAQARTSTTVDSEQAVSGYAAFYGNQNGNARLTVNWTEPSGIAGDTVSEMSKDIWVVFQDKQHNYWFGSDGQGVYRYDGVTTLHFSTRQGLCHDRVREIKEDAAGNKYFGTLGGISKFDGQRFTTLIAAESDAFDHGWKLAPGDLWFKGGRGGPFRYDGKTLYHLKFPRHRLEDDYYRQFPNTPIDPYDIYYIYKDRKGSIWFGTGALGIYRYDGKDGGWLYEAHLTQVTGGGSFGIRSILEDRNGKFWFCNTKYRYVIHPVEPARNGSIRYTREKGIGQVTDPMGGDRIYFQTIVEDSQGDLWLQTYQAGIWRYDGKRFTHYPVKYGTTNAQVIAMYQDKDGLLWLGTQGQGVYKFNGKLFEPFDKW